MLNVVANRPLLMTIFTLAWHIMAVMACRGMAAVNYFKGDDVSQDVEEKINAWLEEIVIGLQLCPFALKPIREARHRIFVSQADDAAAALEAIQSECQRLDNISAEQLETTLLVLPKIMQEFYDFNDFLAIANKLLNEGGWEGVYQLASFHPRYQFAGTEPTDLENLTNAAPFPVVHILREDSLEKAISVYPDVDDIPSRNIVRMQGLSKEQQKRLFYFLH